MSRVALAKQIKLVIAAVVVVAMVATGVATYTALGSQAVHTVANTQHQLTEISYRGQNGIDALTLLKRHAVVGVKHYSFGDMVTSINGSDGSGPKYWTLYVNDNKAVVGAGAYIAKDSDTLSWKLQQL